MADRRRDDMNNNSINTEDNRNQFRTNQNRRNTNYYRNVENNNGIMDFGNNNNNNIYRDGRKVNQVESKNMSTENQDRSVAVDLRAGMVKTEAGIKALDERKEEILKNLENVNNSLVEFYDEMIDGFGAQGLKDANGKPYSSADYPTPSAKLAVLNGIVHYNVENRTNFKKEYAKVLDIAKNKKQNLKDQSIKVLNDQKELIAENKQLIKDAELDIEQNKQKSQALEKQKLEEKNKAEVALKNKETIKEKIKEIKAEIDKLNKDMEKAREEELKNNVNNQGNGRQRGANQTGAKYVETIGRNIQQKENFLAEFDTQALQYNNEYETCTANVSNIQKEKENLDLLTSHKENTLNELKTKQSELIKKYFQSIPDFDKAFEENISGFYDDGIRLNYEKDGKGEKEDVVNSSTPSDTQAAIDNEEQKVQQAQKAGDIMGAPVANVLPANVTEEELARNYIYHFTHSMSASERRQVVNGPGFKRIIRAMDTAGRHDRRALKYALEDMQQDLEENIPSKNEFKKKMSAVLSGYKSQDLENLYDIMFVDSPAGYKMCQDVSKIDLDEIRQIQKALDTFTDLKFTGSLIADQAQIFEDNFAKFAKITTLLQNNMNGTFGKTFKRLFNGREYNAQRKLLMSFSEYSQSRFNDIKAQYEELNEYKRSLGAMVEDTPKYAENIGSVERPNRDLINDVEDGKMNYR